MGVLISHGLFACCILAFYYVWYALRRMDLHYKENVLFIFTCIGSGVWNLGFYGIMVQSDPDIAYYWRLVGMAGVFCFLIFVTVLVTYIAGMKKWIRRMIYGYACLGIILYFGLAQKNWLYIIKPLLVCLIPFFQVSGTICIQHIQYFLQWL